MEKIKKVLEERELEAVTGGTGSGSGYNYVSLYFAGSSLILYAGYDVSNVNVYQDGLKIYYTYKMTAGQRDPIFFSGTAPLRFKVIGRSTKNLEDFEYSFDLS